MTALAAAQLLLTIAALSFGVVAAFADLNRTHACNPCWTGHARFHVVWQTATHLGIAVIVVGIVWAPNPPSHLALVFACALCAAVLVSFFVAAFTMRAYGGRLTDENGYPPVRVRAAARSACIDLNVLLFTVAIAALIAAVTIVL